MKSRIVVSDVAVTNGRQFRLGPLSLSLKPGVTCLVGANGAGKSTLFRALSGIQPLAGGKIDWLVGVERSLGYLAQDVDLPGAASCAGFLAHVAWLQGVPKADRNQAVTSALVKVGLGDRGSAPIRQLSGGMKRRLAFAAALVNSPALLLLDEPTVGLDPIQRENMRQIVRQASSERAVLLSTHLLEDVRAVADYVVVLANGQVTFSGNRSDVVPTPSDQTRFSDDFDKCIADLMAVAE